MPRRHLNRVEVLLTETTTLLMLLVLKLTVVLPRPLRVSGTAWRSTLPPFLRTTTYAVGAEDRLGPSTLIRNRQAPRSEPSGFSM